MYHLSVSAHEKHSDARNFEIEFQNARRAFLSYPRNVGHTIFPGQEDIQSIGSNIENVKDIVNKSEDSFVKFIRLFISVRYEFDGLEGFTFYGGIIHGSVECLYPFKNEYIETKHLKFSKYPKAQLAE